jgi:hypothetical protein
MQNESEWDKECCLSAVRFEMCGTKHASLQARVCLKICVLIKSAKTFNMDAPTGIAIGLESR